MNNNLLDLAKKRWLLILPLASLAVLLLVTLLRPAPALKSEGVLPPLVHTQTVQREMVSPFVMGYGRVRPKETWLALSEVSGPIIYRHPQLEEGQALPAGTVLLRVDPVDYQLKLAQAKSDLSSAKAELTRTQLNESNLALSLRLEQQQLTILNNELERKQGLLQNGSVSQSSVDLEQRNVLAQQHKVLDIENTIKQFPSDLEVVESKVAVAESRLEEAQRKLQKTEITLPFDARIAQVDAEMQQVVKEGQTLVMAHNIGVMEVPVQVSMPEMRNFTRFLGELPSVGGKFPDIKDWNLQAEVKLYVGANAFFWQGSVTNVGESIDPQGNTVKLLVSVDMDKKPFEPGKAPPLINDMFVEVRIKANPINLVMVPADAVHGNRVYTLAPDNSLLVKPVTLAFENNGKVVVANGLDAGEILITSDVIPAIPGMTLRSEGK